MISGERDRDLLSRRLRRWEGLFTLPFRLRERSRRFYGFFYSFLDSTFRGLSDFC